MSEVTAVPLRPVARGGIVALWGGVALLIACGVGAGYATTRSAVLMGMPPAAFMAANGQRAGVRTTPSGLEYEVIKAGSGPTPTAADIVQVDYVGKLMSGVTFDASKPGQPVEMPVGQVVPGFAEALQLMPRGAKYRFWLPPQIAYGDRGDGPIPANSVLVFDVTMHDFVAMPKGMPGIPGM